MKEEVVTKEPAEREEAICQPYLFRSSYFEFCKNKKQKQAANQN